jgi:hypothetical protein
LQRGVTTQPGVGIGETGTGTPADLALGQRVRAQLLNSLGAAATAAGAVDARAGLTPNTLRHVQINANNGVVTLQGTVATEAERRLLEAQLRQMTGIQSIVNNLRVGTAGVQTDQGTPGALGTGAGTGAGAGPVTTVPNAVVR